VLGLAPDFNGSHVEFNPQQRSLPMGLDMYAFTTAADISAVDFEKPADAVEIAYWRKHPDLHGWMETLYRAKGGSEDSFNCAPVRLDLEDIAVLEKAVWENVLPHTEGFFFGRSDGSERADDEYFIHKARTEIAKGRRVFYTSWW
jgi:hypothetical protein